ncbi:MAG: HpcH/HpaI aldolase family protein [Limnochordia bacterium]
MRENHVKKKLQAGEPSVGSWLAIPSPFSAERVARMGFDWLVVDMEHNPINIETAATMFAAINQTDTAPMVRIPWNHPEHVKRVLDAGAWGIVVPMVCSRQEAEDVVAAAKFPPAGIRSNGGGRYDIALDTDRDTYNERANDDLLVIVQIEHIDAVERAEEILSVPGVDGCFIGPLDLMTSMGMIGRFNIEAPEVKEAIAEVVRASKKCGVAAGIHVQTGKDVLRRIDEGFQFIALASDMNLMVAGIKQEKGIVDNR